jgi:phenylalanyl-tRNA synthetase alpha chain
MNIKIESAEEARLKAELEARTDTEAMRMKRLLAMPDLSRTEGSPIKAIFDHIKSQPDFRDFDVIETPEIIPTDVIYKLFNYPEDHPERSPSNTYYVDESHILRPMTTIMWHYYLNRPEVKARLAKEETLGFFSHGKVYRKDEIDARHMNVFHQIDGGFLIPKARKHVSIDDLQNVLSSIAKAVFGPDITYRFNVDKFPYTDPSLEMEVEVNGRWVEVLGCGIMTDALLANMGLDPEKWSNWAFGFGIERLAIISMALPDIRLLWSTDPRVVSQLKLGQTYKEVSKFPPVVRDISFVVPKSFVPNDYFDLIREVGGDMVEDVALIDKYENDQKFGADKMSYTYRITYRHLEKTLTSEEVNTVHQKLEERTEQEFGAEIRRA